VRAVARQAAVANRRSRAPGDTEQAIHRSTFRQIAQTLRGLLAIPAVEIKNRNIWIFCARLLDQRRDPRQPIDVPVNIIGVQNDKPLHCVLPLHFN
jgi:hypothetical protein